MTIQLHIRWSLRLARRSREPLAVTHLGRPDAPARFRLPAAVERPPGALVEATRARVVLQHPQRHLLVLARQLLLGALDQRTPGSRRPVVGVDIDRIELADPTLVAARPDRREADDRPVPLGDESRPAGGRALEALAPPGRLHEAAAVELLHGEHMAIRALPPPLLDPGDALRVLAGCRSDTHRVKGRLPPPCSSNTCSSSGQARWAGASPRSSRRPAGASRCTTRTPAPSSGPSTRCAGA